MGLIRNFVGRIFKPKVQQTGGADYSPSQISHKRSISSHTTHSTSKPLAPKQSFTRVSHQPEYSTTQKKKTGWGPIPRFLGRVGGSIARGVSGVARRTDNIVQRFTGVRPIRTGLTLAATAAILPVALPIATAQGIRSIFRGRGSSRHNIPPYPHAGTNTGLEQTRPNNNASPNHSHLQARPVGRTQAQQPTSPVAQEPDPSTPTQQQGVTINGRSVNTDNIQGDLGGSATANIPDGFAGIVSNNRGDINASFTGVNPVSTNILGLNTTARGDASGVVVGHSFNRGGSDTRPGLDINLPNANVIGIGGNGNVTGARVVIVPTRFEGENRQFNINSRDVQIGASRFNFNGTAVDGTRLTPIDTGQNSSRWIWRDSIGNRYNVPNGVEPRVVVINDGDSPAAGTVDTARFFGNSSARIIQGGRNEGHPTDIFLNGRQVLNGTTVTPDSQTI